jgi:hypothetical protein
MTQACHLDRLDRPIVADTIACNRAAVMMYTAAVEQFTVYDATLGAHELCSIERICECQHWCVNSSSTTV